MKKLILISFLFCSPCFGQQVTQHMFFQGLDGVSIPIVSSEIYKLTNCNLEFKPVVSSILVVSYAGGLAIVDYRRTGEVNFTRFTTVIIGGLVGEAIVQGVEGYKERKEEKKLRL